MFQRRISDELITALLTVIDGSHNYIKAAFTTDYVELEYWVKDPYKYTKTQIFFYDDYHMKPFKKMKQVSKVRDVVYAQMALAKHHRIYDDKHWKNQEWREGIPCIVPQTGRKAKDD